MSVCISYQCPKCAVCQRCRSVGHTDGVDWYNYGSGGSGTIDTPSKIGCGPQNDYQMFVSVNMPDLSADALVLPVSTYGKLDIEAPKVNNRTIELQCDEFKVKAGEISINVPMPLPDVYEYIIINGVKFRRMN